MSKRTDVQFELVEARIRTITELKLFVRNNKTMWYDKDKICKALTVLSKLKYNIYELCNIVLYL